MDYRYYEEDKAISREILGEFDGQTFEQECPTCHAKPVKGKVCDDCKGNGFYEVEY